MHAPVDVVSSMLQMALFCWALLAKENFFFIIITMQYSHYSATTITEAHHLDKVDQSDYRKN